MKFNREFNTDYYKAHPSIEHYEQFIVEDKETPCKIKTVEEAIYFKSASLEDAKKLLTQVTQLTESQQADMISYLNTSIQAADTHKLLSVTATAIVEAHRLPFPDPQKINLSSEIRAANDKFVKNYEARASDYYQLYQDALKGFSSTPSYSSTT